MFTFSSLRRGLSALLLLAGMLRAQAPGQAAGPLRVSIPEVQSLANPNLDPAAKDVKDWTFTIGHGKYVLTGKVATLKAGAKTCGLYFKGQGLLTYTTVNRLEFPNTLYNLKKNSYEKPVVTADSVAFNVPFEEGILWFAAMSIPEPQGTATELPAKDFQVQMDYFQEMEDKPFLHSLALRHLKTTTTPYFHGQLRAKTKPWTHTLDGLDSERVDALHFRSAAWGFWRPWAQISRQPIGWDYRNPKVPRFVLTHADIDVDATKGPAARIKVTETYLPLESGLTALDLDLDTREAGISATGSIKMQPVILHSVKDAKGNPLAFSHRNMGLLVMVPGMQAQVPVTLTFEIGGEPLLVDERANYWLLGTWAWHPMPSDLAGQAYTTHATVRVPAPYVPIMGGNTIRRVKEGDTNILETKFETPIQFFSILAGKYELKEETKNGITVRVAGYVELGPGGKNLPKVAHGIIAYYQSILGPFPVKEITLVDMDYLGGGQAPPGIAFLGTQAFHPTDNIINRIIASGNVNQLVAHEISHQYWGQVVKMWSYEDQWITESFAEYSSLLAVMNMRSKGQDEYNNTVDEWFRMASLATKASTIPLANSLDPEDDNWEERRFRPYLIYYKGACLLYRIHKDIGDADFIRFLRSYIKTMGGKHSTTAHVPMIVKALTGKDYSKFMEDYYWGLEMPPRKP